MKYLIVSIAIIFLAILGTLFYKSQNPMFPYFKNDKEVIGTFTKKTLSTDFHYPVYSASTEIVNAEIETITFKNNGNTFEAQIFKKIDGVPDNKIIDINNRLTNNILKDGLSDIRNPKNIVVNTDVSIEMFESYITYADKGIIQYHIAYELDIENAAHPVRNPGNIFTIYIIGDDTPLFKKDMKDSVLRYFYPNGEKILSSKIDEADMGDNPCYSVSDFPNSFDPFFNAITREVVFKVDFPYSQIGTCEGEVEIGIPLDDILKEVPQYIADDSLLLRFK